jgi:hypothetical protein
MSVLDRNLDRTAQPAVEWRKPVATRLPGRGFFGPADRSGVDE